jgi:hypothetical protein
MFLVDTGPADPGADGGRLEAEEERPSTAKAMPGRWGLIAAPDLWIIPPRFREVRAFADGVTEGAFWAKPTHKWQLVSGRGDLLTGAVFDQVETAVGGVAVVRTANQWNAIDRRGTTLLPLGVEAVRRRPDGLVAYQQRERIGVIGLDGTVNVPPLFDRIGTFVGDRAPAVRDGMEVWIDGKGESSTAPISAASGPGVEVEKARAKAFSGRVMTCPDGLSLKAGPGGWTFVDRQWHQAVEGSYAAARCFVRGVAFVVRAGASQWTRIDRKGVATTAAPSCRLPDYVFDAGGTAGRQPACGPLAADSEASGAARRGGGP